MTNTKPNYNQIIDELFYQIDEGKENNFFSMLEVPAYHEERTKAYAELCETLNALFPENKDFEFSYERPIVDYEEVCRQTAFRTGFMCAVALGKISRMD